MHQLTAWRRHFSSGPRGLFFIVMMASLLATPFFAHGADAAGADALAEDGRPPAEDGREGLGHGTPGASMPDPADAGRRSLPRRKACGSRGVPEYSSRWYRGGAAREPPPAKRDRAVSRCDAEEDDEAAHGAAAEGGMAAMRESVLAD